MTEGVRTIETNPIAMLQLAVEKGADVDQLTRLMELKERYEANEARKAFTVAMAEFKKNPPQIVKDKQVAFLDVRYKHAELDQVAAKIGAALALVGIAHRWDVDQKSVPGQVSVTCILTHALGHSESVTIAAPPDNSGKKNPVQQVASTISYLQRYTILSATGLATGEADNDGRTIEQDEDNYRMPEADFQGHIANMDGANTVEDLKKAYFAGFNQVHAKDTSTKEAMTKHKNARYRALTGTAASQGGAR
jgi:hypothetical protein